MAELIVIDGPESGREFTLRADQTLGRLQANDIPIHDAKMSRKNTRIFRQGKHWVIQDLGSKNGTWLNGESIEAERLEDGDEIRVGETLFRFAISATSPEGPAGLAEVSKATQAGSRRGGGAVSERALSFSKWSDVEQTRTSFFSLRQDLSQRDAGFRFLVFLGVLLVAVGIFFLIQFLIAGAD
ncbi:MAG TPA: FHA domain-containing protein [Planctomycetes bacterium]|nr:FHA domain-containing protein [Planctomycetota bacterium]